ncbi:hypothetical protein [Streptomyces sp. NPDC057540]|uniref:hypothetical protein n=1 Tax=Streptomyces sp. NPDC057540 TaxID=3346160 RepID=UPI0036B6610F
MSQGYDYAMFYARGGREAVEKALALLARRLTWAELIHEENIAILAMERARSTLLAHLDQTETEAAKRRVHFEALAATDSVPSTALRSLAARLDELEAEVAELQAEVELRDAEIESVASASLSRFHEDPASGNVPLR